MFIKLIRTWVPQRYSQQKLLKHFGLADNNKARRIFEAASIESRHFMINPVSLVSDRESKVSFPWFRTLYQGPRPNFLIELSNLDTPQYEREDNYLHLPYLWCPGSIRALQLASSMRSRTLIICVDANSLLHWKPDFSEANDIVSYALFGDGIASILIEPSTSKGTPKLFDFEFRETSIDLVSYQAGKLLLNHNLPSVVTNLVEECLKGLLNRHRMSVGEIKRWIVHPAGRKVLDNLESHFRIDLNFSRKVLKEYGNIGASSVFFILKEVMASNPQWGDYGVILSFGPGKDGGFNVAACLLQW